MSRRALALLLGGCLWSWCFSLVSAQTTEPSSVELVPPRFVQGDLSAYPSELRDTGLGAAVDLWLTIDAEGRVDEVMVVGSGGESFDAAAVAAVLRYRFEPARRGQQTIVARIAYRYVFHPPEPVTIPASEVEKRMQNKEVFPAGVGGAAARLPSPVATVAPEQKVAAEEEDDAYSATATVDDAPREVVRRTLQREEILKVPGTRGDAIRAVELLPGVHRPPFGTGQLIVRGSAPGDSEAFVEGSALPLVYHFGGLTSVFNSLLLQRLDFYPGNFGTRYGRRIGGILEIGVRDPRRDRFGALLDINVIDATALVETPLDKKKKFTLALAARRSYIDFFVRSFSPSNGRLTAAPVYWDYQGILTYTPTRRDRLRLLTYGSSDHFALVGLDPADSDPNLRGNIDFATSFHRADLSWTRQLSSKVDQRVSVSLGPNKLRFAFGPDLKFDLSFLQMYGRAEWRMRLSRRFGLTSGLDIFVAPYDLNYRGPQPGQTEGQPMQESLSTMQLFDRSHRGTSLRPGLYVEADMLATDKLRFVLGLRGDYFSEVQGWALNPRLSTIYSLTERTRLKAGVGLYSQAPEFQESDATLGNPQLKPIQSVHSGIGAEHQVFAGLTIGGEAFYKYLFDRVVSTTGAVAPYYRNDGVGRIYGLELLVRLPPSSRRRLYGLGSYTLSRSQRNDRGEGWRLFDFDQTHIFNLVAGYRLGRGWELSGRFGLISGNPTTPVVGSVYSSDDDLYVPVYGKVNSVRNPLYHRADLRIQKQWTFRVWSLMVYLDVRNLYNYRNQEGISYNYDYSQSQPISGLPIIPALGLRGEL